MKRHVISKGRYQNQSEILLEVKGGPPVNRMWITTVLTPINRQATGKMRFQLKLVLMQGTDIILSQTHFYYLIYFLI